MSANLFEGVHKEQTNNPNNTEFGIEEATE